eukprot:gene25348-31794_t
MDHSRMALNSIKAVGLADAFTSKSLAKVLQFGHNLEYLVVRSFSMLNLTLADYSECNQLDAKCVTKLTRLDLCGCVAFTDEALQLVTASCTKLSTFNCQFCSLITDTSVCALVSRNPGLQVCSLNGSGVGNASLLAIAQHCPDFEYGNFNTLRNDQVITDDSVVELVTKCPKLTHLLLKDASEITDVSIEALARCSPLLKALHVGRTISNDIPLAPLGEPSRITARALNLVVQSCPLMHTFDLSECSDIDRTVRLIAKRCPLLIHLNITENLTASNNITEDTMASLTQSCPELTHLIAMDCNKCITDTTLASLAEHCPKLEFLNIFGCMGVTDKGCAKLAEHSSKLFMLDILGCYLVSAPVVVALTAGCPLLGKLVTCCMTGSIAILNAVIENSPFMVDLSVAQDITVMPAVFNAAVKNAQSQLPRCRVSVAIAVPIYNN